MNNINVSWDYTQRAATYDLRADYDDGAILELLRETGCEPNTEVAEVGAGTGKLSKLLLSHGLVVSAVEPNDAMRKIGIQNTSGKTISWTKAAGEDTGLPEAAFQACFFGSSFNVVDQEKGLNEAARLLMNNGYFGCMWNHRDLDDPLQKSVEEAIISLIPSYSYGARREDPTAVVAGHPSFGPVKKIERKFVAQIPSADWLDAWKSHATLARQAGTHFAEVIELINNLLASRPSVEVPYHTRIWYAQRNQRKKRNSTNVRSI